MVISGDQWRQRLFLSVNQCSQAVPEPFSNSQSPSWERGWQINLEKTSGLAPPANVPCRICPVILNSAEHGTEYPSFCLSENSAQRRADLVEMSQLSSNLNL